MKLTTLLIASGIYGLATSGQASLIAHYKFDEPAAATTALNEVAGGSTGAVGAGVTTGVAGIAGNAYSFTGGADQADIVDMANASFLSSMTSSNAYTLCAWVNTSEAAGGRNVVVFAGNDTDTNDYADLGTTAVEAGHEGEAYARNRPNTNNNPPSPGFFSNGAKVIDGTWHHIAMTVNLVDQVVSLYVDGVLTNTQAMPIVEFPIFNNFEIGRLGRSAPTDGYEGLVDDVQVYDEALTPSQIGFIKDHPGQPYSSADTDADGLVDAWEIQHFGDITSQSGNDVGPDMDGATNLQEQAAGTDPTVADTDSDDRTDGDELNTPPLSNPLDPDSDDDGLTDGAEVNIHGTDPNNVDSDFDTLPDAWELASMLNPNSHTGDDGANGDPDGDDLLNFEEYREGVDSTDPQDPDSDNDGYTDLQEDRFGTWGSVELTGTNPNNPDTDGDGILDGQENPDLDYVAGVTSGTDPNLLDTDMDGYNDRSEFVFGSDPTDDQAVPVVAKGLVAHYKFDEAAAATTAVNALGNSPGAVGSAVTTGVAGVAGNAYQFNNLFGQNDIVDMGNAEILTDIIAGKALTYTAWIKSTDISAGRNCILSVANTTLDNSYVDSAISGQGTTHIGALTGRIRPDGNANNAEIFSDTPPSTTLVNDDAWHHIAMTIDLATTSIRLYVDGVPTAENLAIPLAQFPVFNNFEIGRLGRKAPTDAFEGLIDDVQVYNEALTPARIAALFSMPGVSADEDHDRLDDQWEIDNFGSIAAYNGSDDPDGDGFDNETEESAGTDPAPSNSTKITSVSFVFGGDYIINFTGNPNAMYRVTKSTTLGGFAEMDPPVTATTDGSGNGVATVPASQAAGSKGFYRLETP